MLGSLGVDARRAIVLYQQAAEPAFLPNGATVLFEQWNHFRLVLDFISDSYFGFVNGVQVVSTGLSTIPFTQELNTFSDADIMDRCRRRRSGLPRPHVDRVFDNFMIRDGLPGDYDLDGDVDNGDYNRWRETFGQTVGVAGN